MQARYWAFLFGNLQSAVDAIYKTCEEDENISECKEVILVLENFTKDFHNLIEWFKVKWAYETSTPPLRKTPLAWEVRKTSPCRTWNSSIVQQVNSTSPIEQTIIEHEVTATNDKSESMVKSEVSSKTAKVIKETKNQAFKNDSKSMILKTLAYVKYIVNFISSILFFF